MAPAPAVRRSPHIVMVSLAGGEAATRDQQAYLIKLQDQIAARWYAVPAKLKYTVGLEFTVTQPGLCCNTQPVSSLAPRKTIESCRDALTKFFTRALSVKTEDRYPSALELLQAWNAATAPRTKEERVTRPIDQVKQETRFILAVLFRL